MLERAFSGKNENVLSLQIEKICKEAKDWQDALEEVAENHPELEDREIVRAIIDYFFPLRS